MPTEKWTIQSLGEALAIHVAGDEDKDKKLDSLYQTIVTGNSHEPLVRTVARHSEWIAGVNKVIWAVVLGVIGVTITSVGSLVYMIFRIYPILQQIEKLEPISRMIGH